jgi:hypothetical protein
LDDTAAGVLRCFALRALRHAPTHRALFSTFAQNSHETILENYLKKLELFTYN